MLIVCAKIQGENEVDRPTMRVATSIRGCIELRSQLHVDARGWLTKPIYPQVEVPIWTDTQEISEVFWSESTVNVFRGMHLQLPPFAIEKVVLCIQGFVVDYVMDLRSDSSTFQQVVSIDLSSSGDHARGVVIPKGCAHGFRVCSSSAVILYLQSGPRVEEFESGVQAIDVNQSLDHIIISDRDRSLPRMTDFPILSEADWNA